MADKLLRKLIADDPRLPAEQREVVTLADQLATVLERRGGTVGEFGYCGTHRSAEVIVRAPDGTLLELTLRRIPTAPELGDARYWKDPV